MRNRLPKLSCSWNLSVRCSGVVMSHDSNQFLVRQVAWISIINHWYDLTAWDRGYLLAGERVKTWDGKDFARRAAKVGVCDQMLLHKQFRLCIASITHEALLLRNPPRQDFFQIASRSVGGAAGGWCSQYICQVTSSIFIQAACWLGAFV